MHLKVNRLQLYSALQLIYRIIGEDTLAVPH
jgi:hypothetical protein